MIRFILHKGRVLERYNLLKELGLEVSYSLKTNVEVGKILEEVNSFFSVHNLKELGNVKNKERVWYFLLAAREEELEELFKLNVRNFVIDLEDDLETLLEFIKKKNDKINLLLRMKLKENTMFSGKHYVFGLDSKKIDELILKLKDNELIDKLGIHFHRKTQNFSEWSLIEEVESLSKESLERLDLVNIGGGLPGKYKNTNDMALQIILNDIKKFKEWFKKEVIIEPGRFIASYAIDLECNIIAKDKNTLFVNFSIFNGALDTIIANVKLLVDGEKEKGDKYLIKGITPDSSDILRYEVFLDNPKVGDVIKFLNVGAYNYHSDFCSLEKVSTVVV